LRIAFTTILVTGRRNSIAWEAGGASIQGVSGRGIVESIGVLSWEVKLLRKGVMLHWGIRIFSSVIHSRQKISLEHYLPDIFSSPMWFRCPPQHLNTVPEEVPIDMNLDSVQS
jgi:hypothetical protein